MAAPGAHLPPGVDPRPAPSDEAAAVDSGGALRPAVAGSGPGSAPWLAGGGAVLLGLVAFLWLSSHRAHPLQDANTLQPPNDAAVALAAPVQPPPGVDAMEAAGRGARAMAPPPAIAVVTPPPPPSPAPSPAPVAASAPTDGVQAGKAPVLVVDLAPAGGAPVAVAPGAAAAAGGKSTDAAHPAGSTGLNSDEQFAARVETSSEPERARATMLRNQSTVAPQGTMIPAVLETALNSDLPGYARAVVSRDVRSFDGSTVLIPRGSRVIGEYRSAVALGQSRAFVIWTRVLRPDGGSIQIGSGGGDLLGRAGLAGQVDRHFFERFSGAVLLTVLNAGATALAGNNSTTVVVGSSSEATGLASSVSALAPASIPPTIKVAQGTPVRIFVARDLDFTPVDGRGQ